MRPEPLRVLAVVDDNAVARAIAHGRVVSTGEDRVTIEHLYYENHERRTIRSIETKLASVSVDGDGATIIAVYRGLDADGEELVALGRTPRIGK